MSTPKPGQPVRGSSSGRPIMALLDLLGRRWTLRILWELRGDPLTFRALRAACDDLSPSVLNERLGDLRETEIVVHTDAGYTLSDQGRTLLAVLAPLNDWAQEWAKRIP